MTLQEVLDKLNKVAQENPELLNKDLGFYLCSADNYYPNFQGLDTRDYIVLTNLEVRESSFENEPHQLMVEWDVHNG